MKREFRWEFKEVGQGHYYRDFKDCVNMAMKASEENLTLTIVVQTFPIQRVLFELKAGKFLD